MLVSKASSRFDLSVRLFKKGEETPPLSNILRKQKKMVEAK